MSGIRLTTTDDEKRYSYPISLLYNLNLYILITRKIIIIHSVWSLLYEEHRT